MTTGLALLEDRASDPDCPVCDVASSRVGDAPNWGEWRRCTRCALDFVNPLRRPQDPVTLFSGAYDGKVREAAMGDFRMRIDQRRVILDQLRDPTLWFWTPAFTDVLAWAEARLKPGATILELGCGLGFFLHALRSKGFVAVGLDVAEAACDLNRRDGFQVWHGTLESMPDGWVQPDAVVAFFMFHHLEDPLSFLTTIRRRWPAAPLAIAQYGPSNRLDAASTSPPRTLLRWNARALAHALERAGYAPEVRNVASTGSEASWLRPIRKRLAGTMAPWVYKLGRQAEMRILPCLGRRVTRDAYVVLAFAEPTDTVRTPEHAGARTADQRPAGPDPRA